MKNVKKGHTKPIVCLDAGHYGKYNRSPVVKEYYESVQVWLLHQYLAAALEDYGIEVWRTRSKLEKDLALTARGRASKGADLFISLHSNACGTESVDRPVAIYLVDDNCGTIDESSKEIAGLLAEMVREVMQTKDPARTYSKKSGNDRDGDGLKNDDYYGVLFGCHQVGTAGLILEHSFHTNTRAANWLLNESNLKTLAEEEAKVIAAWFGVDKPASAPQKPQDEPVSGDKYYRIRKTWKDKESQVGAFVSLEKAKAACPYGYTVYDWHATAVYSKEVDPAKDFHQSKAGTYVVKSSDGSLNLRSGAGAEKALIETMKNGEKVVCYGFHTGEWLYVISESGKTGFCHSGYLEERK